MDANTFDAMTRRASLRTLGAAGLVATLTHPSIAEAKNKKRKKKRKKGDANELCKQQVGQCVDFFSPVCDLDPTCLAAFEGCCSILGNCNLTDFFSCLEVSANASAIGP